MTKWDDQIERLDRNRFPTHLLEALSTSKSASALEDDRVAPGPAHSQSSGNAPDYGEEYTGRQNT